MKVGLFFGTFDPVHNGHVTIAETAISTNLIDQVWFVVTPQSPFKKNSIISSKEHRLKMVDIAIHRYSNFFSSNVEFELETPQYTFKTLSFLESKFKSKHEFSLIMGLDNYISLVKKEWRHSDYILNKYHMFIYERHTDNHLRADLHLLGLVFSDHHVRLTGSSIKISSSQIRELLYYKNNLLKSCNNNRHNISLSNQQLDSFLPKKVLEYIEKNELYLSVK
ncbi:MAG: nicotinate (nicotinamide) nucleotide adenylyltransferase [Flavobacteriales bacterium]|nr:nicotinate (nicotinamide) nucleotide adenylyltransferase [Flavobacteriales bacterium]